MCILLQALEGPASPSREVHHPKTTRSSVLSAETMSTQLQENWFMEAAELWPGRAFFLEMKEVIHREKTEFQDVLIFNRLGPTV